MTYLQLNLTNGQTLRFPIADPEIRPTDPGPIETTRPWERVETRDHTIEATAEPEGITGALRSLGWCWTPPGETEGQDDPHPAVEWWVEDAREVAEATMPKAIEYGSIELVEAGRTLARLMGLPDVSDQAAMETQIYQYVMGKMGRWTAAMARGERVSDDTILDLMVYATMVRKIRQTGEWP